jgi:alanyl-tRNA synthetase
LNGENIFQVLDTQKIDNVSLHAGKVKSGKINKGDSLIAKVNVERRLNIARNHTATHILQAALRKVLGSHVQQQGSLVGEEKLRFDFTHFKSLAKDEISRVEEIANSYIAANYAVDSCEMALKEARKTGALAFFQEKYAEVVRVVNISEVSKELCAGTHLDNLSEIGLIKIISEGSVASGIRRIEAVTAGFDKRFIEAQEQKAIEEAQKKIKLEELKEEEKRQSVELSGTLADELPRLINKNLKINGINAVISVEDSLDMKALRILADMVKEKLDHALIALGSQDKDQERVFLVVAVTQDLLSRGIDAGALIRQVAPTIGGSGGGRQDFAQAGGNNPAGLNEALEELKRVVIRL